MSLIFYYLLISGVVAVYDVIRLKNQDEELNSFPQGDIGYYIEPKRILGIHNVIFFPSLLIICAVILINKVFF